MLDELKGSFAEHNRVRFDVYVASPIELKIQRCIIDLGRPSKQVLYLEADGLMRRPSRKLPYGESRNLSAEMNCVRL